MHRVLTPDICVQLTLWVLQKIVVLTRRKGERTIKVLSLFDGISCGRIALERAHIPVDRYVAYEIEPNAIQISKNNYPNIEHKGDVLNADFSEYIGFDLVIGGSPCQDLSFLGRSNGSDGLTGSKSKLFYIFVQALEIIKPKYFLFENVYRMKPQYVQKISDLLKCKPVCIDSIRFSAQYRKRLYWTNIPVLPIKSKDLYLKDIYQFDEVHEDITDRMKRWLSDEYKGRRTQQNARQSIRHLNEKCPTVTTKAWDVGSTSSLVIEIDDRYYRLTRVEYERLQTLPDNYTRGIAYGRACKCIGNGWTVDVIAHIFKGLK